LLSISLKAAYFEFLITGFAFGFAALFTLLTLLTLLWEELLELTEMLLWEEFLD